MTAFVDTSALFALCDEDDAAYSAAATYFERTLPTDTHVTHAYVVVETISLAQRRLGMGAVRRLVNGLLQGLEVVAVTSEEERAAVAALLASESRSVSLVDRVSFEFMRRRGLTRAFAFDRDFARAGFETVP